MRPAFTLPLVILPIVALAACAPPRQRVEAGLLQGGVQPAVARCMADEMTRRLSPGQLQKLSRARAMPGEPTTNLTVRDFLERARRVGDVEVVGVTTAAAALCAALN